MESNNRKRNTLISLQLESTSYEAALSDIVTLSKKRRPAYICFANVHMVIEAFWDKNFAEQVNAATLVLPDGMPLVKVLNFFYKKDHQRVAGMDAFPDILKLASINSLKVFLFGSTDEQLNRICLRAKNEYPSINVVGTLSPAFDQPLDSDDYVNTINASGAHIVFVALGCPKQERWMAKHTQKIDATLLGVGGAFAVYAGAAKRAPDWMRNNSLEWLFRLIQEPKRMWRRYLVTNTLFIFLCLKQLIVKGINR